MSEWNYCPEVIARAQELPIGTRVAIHWVEAEAHDQEGTVVGIGIERYGRVNYSVHIDGDISPTDEFRLDHTGRDACSIRPIDPNAAPTAMQPEDGLIETLLDGVRPCGMHDDNETELFDIDCANETMSEAAAIITSLRAENARLRAGLKPFARMAEADDYAGTPEGASVIVNVDRLRAARQIIDQKAGK